MKFTWKGNATQSVYASNARPELQTLGPYPTRPPNDPQTTKKVVAVYDAANKTVGFSTVDCTTVSTSLPTVCQKKLPRPLKIWRKRLDPNSGACSKVTLNQVNGIGSSTTEHLSNQPVFHTDIPKRMETIHIRRSGGRPKTCEGQLPNNTCMSTREYLQKRGKTFDQNQAKGRPVSAFTYEGSQSVKDPRHCTEITVKPSNPKFQVQGGVSASSRTNQLKYHTVQANVAQANYATARATLDTGHVNVKSQNRPEASCISVVQDRAHVTACAYTKR